MDAGIIINPGCSLNCFFCGNKGKPPNKKELKKQEVQIYKNLIHHRKNGLTRLVISGVDPIEYTKIVELIRYTKKIGCQLALDLPPVNRLVA